MATTYYRLVRNGVQLNRPASDGGTPLVGEKNRAALEAYANKFVPKPWDIVSETHGDGWLDSAVLAAGHAVGSVGHAIGKIPFVGPILNEIAVISSPLIIIASDLAKGQNINHALNDMLKQESKALKGIAPYVKAIIQFVPGIGPIASGAIGAGLSLASGKPITAAVLGAVSAAIPGGVAQDLFKVGVAVSTGNPAAIVASLPLPADAKNALAQGVDLTAKIAKGQPIDPAAIAAGLKLLPPADQAAVKAATQPSVALANAIMKSVPIPAAQKNALQTGIAMGHAQAIQQVQTQQAKSPDMVTELASIGNGMASDPIIACGRKLAGTGSHGYDVGIGLMAHQVGEVSFTTIRDGLTGDDKRGFDMAVSLRIGQIGNPTSAAPPCTQSGYYMTMGMVGAIPDNKVAIMTAIMADPEAKTGATIAIKQIAADVAKKQSLWHKILTFLHLA